MSARKNAWINEIADKAQVDRDTVRSVLKRHAIVPSPVAAAPRRLLLNEVVFSGIKSGVEGEGEFRFQWGGLGPGIWGLLSERNLKGKTSVFEVVRWLLRGRPSERLQADVVSWIDSASLCFALDGRRFRVGISHSAGDISGKLCAVDADGELNPLASFDDADGFAMVMSDFFMRELSLESVTLPQKDKQVVHEWPWLSSAMFMGTEYKAVLGDLATAGLPVRMMQMFLGLPWVSTLSSAVAAKTLQKRQSESEARQRAAEKDRREHRRRTIESDLLEKQEALARLPSDQHVRSEVKGTVERLAEANSRIRESERDLEQARRELEQAQRANADDRRELQAVLDAEAAGAVFRMLQPSICPRCDASVATSARKEREEKTGECYLCAETVRSDADAESARTRVQAQEKASRSVATALEKQVAGLKDELAAAIDLQAELETRRANLEGRLTEFGARQELELDIRVLEARFEEAGLDTESSSETNDEASIIDAAVSVTQALVKERQTELLSDVSTAIVEYARRFGMTLLTSAKLLGNCTLPIVKGGEKTSFGKTTAGERLRLKVAALLAMLRVAESNGVGRHPGLIFIDSPKAQEVAREDLNTLLAGVAEVADELPHLQIILSGLTSPEIEANIPPANCRIVRGEDPLW